MMNLSSAFELYLANNPRIADERTVAHYRLTISAFERHLKRTATLKDLNDDTVRAFMAGFIRRGRSPVTANHKRKCLVALWNWCAKRRMVEAFPTVSKLREPRRVPRAWTEDELKRLVRACQRARGTIGGVRASDWLLGTLAICWDVGERTSAVLQIRWHWLDMERGVLHIPAEFRKGKLIDGCYQLMPDTLSLLKRIRQQNKSERVFPGLTACAFWKRYDTMLARADLPGGRYNKAQKLRRSHASHLHAAGGDATSSLMHSSDAITRRHYLDPTIISTPHAARLFRIIPPIPPEVA